MNKPYNHLWNEKVKDSVELYIQGRDVPVFAVCDRVRPINRRLAGRSETQQAVVLKQRVCAHSTAPACSWAAKWGRTLLGVANWKWLRSAQLPLIRLMSHFDLCPINSYTFYFWGFNNPPILALLGLKLEVRLSKTSAKCPFIAFSYFHLLTDMFSISPKPSNCRQNSGWIESCNNFTGVSSINFTACNKN